MDGDAPMKYRVTLPADVEVGSNVPVSLGGKEFSLPIPDYVAPGQTVIAIAPSASETVDGSDNNSTTNPLVNVQVEVAVATLIDDNVRAPVVCAKRVPDGEGGPTAVPSTAEADSNRSDDQIKFSLSSAPSTSASPSAPLRRATELTAIEYRQTDKAERYQMTIPMDASSGGIVPVNVGGKEFNVRIPGYVIPGETVVVIVPQV
jgi:hypothetical protein